MKKLLISISLLLLPLASSASTASFAPATVTIYPGQSVTLNIIADPQGSAYTAKIAVSFPPDLVSVASFSEAPGWLPLTQPGYDSVDNAAGTLIKTAGFSGGFSSPRVFGSVTFISRAVGTAVVTITSATQLLDANNQNTFTSGGRASLSIISAPAPAVKPVAKPKDNPVRSLLDTKQTATTTILSPAGATSATTSAVAGTASGLANTYSSAFDAKNVYIGMSLLAVVCSFALGLIIGKRRYI